MQICRSAIAACLGAILLMLTAQAEAQYHLKNLVSNQVHQAPTIDPLLANAWGLARSAGGPWWISDNDTGWSTIYNAAGTARVAQGFDSHCRKWTVLSDRPKRPGYADGNCL